MKNVKEFFNENIDEWSEAKLNEKRSYKIVEKFYNCYSKVRNNRPKILDVGCGLGYDSKILTEFGAKVSGIDFSERSIDVAIKNVNNASFFVRDITIPFSDIGRFDGVLCLETLNYVGIQNMRQVINNISNVMKSGALLLISVLDGTSKDLKRSFVKVNGDEYDKNFTCYNVESLCSFAYPKLKLVDTWQFNDFNDGWRYYIFMKQPSNK